MRINSDINILGSLTDWELVSWMISRGVDVPVDKTVKHQFTSIKTTKSLTTSLKVIKDNLLRTVNESLHQLVISVVKKGGLSKEALIVLFWNASANNELLFYLNDNVFFPAYYSGRVSIRKDEVVACLKELKNYEVDLKNWSEKTIDTTASKYLTLLKKFGLMEGSANKNILHPHFSDEVFVLFVYWLAAVSTKPNLVSSNWINYCFSEKQIFLERLLQKKFSKFYNVVYTGDNLTIEPSNSYKLIYENVCKS